jgi:hypothetical protein
VKILRIGFFVYEYPPAIVGGLGTYAEYVTQEYIDIGHDVSVFMLNGGNLKTSARVPVLWSRMKRKSQWSFIHTVQNGEEARAKDQK